MAIGIDWKEIWKPVWKPVWRTVRTVAAPRMVGAGKSRPQRKRKYQVEIDGEVFAVESAAQAEQILEDVRAKAEATAAEAVQRASKAKRRPVRKVLADAKKALVVPEIVTGPDMRDMANQLLGQIRSQYDSAMASIELAALMAKRDREIDDDDEDVLLLL